MVIPDNITIAGIDIKIEFDPNLMKNQHVVGCAVYEKQKIVIDPTIEGRDIRQQTFLHEVVHYILYVMGKQELRRDEEFVDGFAHLAYQIIKQLEQKQDYSDIPFIDPTVQEIPAPRGKRVRSMRADLAEECHHF